MEIGNMRNYMKSGCKTWGFFIVLILMMNPAVSSAEKNASGKITWKMISPFSLAGYQAIAVNPKDANIAYCSIDMLGAYKTIDGGRHWKPVGNDDGNPLNIWRTTTHGIFIDPKNPDTVYVGHRERISKSTDGGKTWKVQNLGNNMTNPRSFACDPLNTQIIYASHGHAWNATNDGFKETWPGYRWGHGALIKTRDGGKHWRVRKLVFPPKSMAYSIIPDPTWPGNKPHECMRIYASTNKGFYISDDAGETWRKKNGKGLPHDRLLGCVMEIDKKKNTPILYLLAQRKGKLPGGMYKSVDRGESWECKTEKAFPEGTIYGQIAYGQLPGVIYVTTPAMIVNGKRVSLPHFRRMKIAPKEWKNNAFGVFKTVDGGDTWQTTTPNPDDIKWGWDWYNKKNKNPDTEGQPTQLAISPANPNIVYYNNLMAVSYDGGKTLRLLTESEKTDPEWKFVRPCGLSGGCISCVVVGSKGRVHFGDADTGYSFSKNRGETWRLAGASSLRDRGMSHQLAGATDTASIIVDPDDPNIVYVCNGLLWGKMARVFKKARGGCFRSDNGGETFTELTSKVASEGVPPRKMCALGLGTGTPEKRTVAVASMNEKFYLSKDSGKSWKVLKANGLLQSDKCFVRQLVFDPENGKRIFALVSPKEYKTLPKNPEHMGLFVSSDEGENWHVLLPGVSGMEFAVVAKKSSVIYVAAYPASAKTTGGVYKTSDQGKNWKKVLDVKYCITVAVNPYNTDIVYAGAGMGWWGMPKKKIGVYRSVNGGENWTVQDTGFRAPNVTCIAIDPSDPHIIYAGVHGCGLWQGFDSLNTKILKKSINK